MMLAGFCVSQSIGYVPYLLNTECPLNSYVRLHSEIDALLAASRENTTIYPIILEMRHIQYQGETLPLPPGISVSPGIR